MQRVWKILVVAGWRQVVLFNGFFHSNRLAVCCSVTSIRMADGIRPDRDVLQYDVGICPTPVGLSLFCLAFGVVLNSEFIAILGGCFKVATKACMFWVYRISWVC